MKRWLSFLLLAWPLVAFNPAHAANRERLLFDFGWKFHLGRTGDMDQFRNPFAKSGDFGGWAGPNYNDAAWRTVNLPHDWAVDLPFNAKADNSHGSHAYGPGFPNTSVGWYRRHFRIPASDRGDRLRVEFEGAFRDTRVWLNGHLLGRNRSGYSPFSYDISDVANYGSENTLVVRCDASLFEGWFYEGAGIYRHVWLVKTSPLHIPQWGTYITSKIHGQTATVTARTHLVNQGNQSAEFVLESSLRDPYGNVVARAQSEPTSLGPWHKTKVVQTFKVDDPKLWSPETPFLYRVMTRVMEKGKQVDHLATTIGLRTIAFDPNKGFLLNGKRYEIKGTCNHQDHAGVGSALPDRLNWYRIQRLKDMGCNAYRTSHNPPTPALLDACDHLGMLVMDENRLLESTPEVLSELKRLVLRDRNHPSVILWSIGNEEGRVQTKDVGARIAATMCRLVRKLDPTRPITYAANVGNVYHGINSVVDVRGWNYHIGPDIDAYHREHPNQPNFGSEQASTLSTRGEYANDPKHSFMSAYDENAPGWGNTAEQWWKFFAARPWLAGGFVWTGFDYRGEPTPYHWPAVSSQFGIMDTCGFPKDNYYYYQSWWSHKTVLHLLPHWNWPGKKGKEIDVRCFSNCDAVELFLNGHSLGKKKMPRNSHLSWKVKYEPGVLSAKGWRGGKVVAETKVETTGVPAAVRLMPVRTTINADGEDVSVVNVSVVDAKGRVVPTADNEIHFECSGAGHILGVGNGNPASHEPDQFISAPTARELATWKVETVAATGPRPELAGDYNDSSWRSVRVNRSRLTMKKPNSWAIFRTGFELTPDNLRHGPIKVTFGSVDDEGWVYVNGWKIGETTSWDRSWTFDISRALHAGHNTIAVLVKNGDGQGGLGKGVLLAIPPAPVHWQRKAFNGLCQVIVQSARHVGNIQFVARAAGLKEAKVTLTAAACNPPPAVP